MATNMTLSKQTGGGDFVGATTMHRLPLVWVPEYEQWQGTPEPYDHTIYRNPAPFAEGVFTITGYSDVFEEMRSWQGKPPKLQRKFKLEFELGKLRNGKSAGNAIKMSEGATFTLFFAWSTYESSGTFKFFNAIDPGYLDREGDWNPALYLGTRFVATTRASEQDKTRFGGLAVEAINPGLVRLAPTVANPPGPGGAGELWTPEAVADDADETEALAVSGDDDDDDPFLVEF